MEITMIQVFQFLRPNGGWVLHEGKLDEAIYLEGVTPVTWDEYKNNIQAAKDDLTNKADATAAAKASGIAKLAALGFTEAEIAAW